MNSHLKLSTVIALIVSCGLVACSGELGRLSDDELRKKIQECDYAVNLSTAEHQVCQNYHRECQRRLNDGRFVCQ